MVLSNRMKAPGPAPVQSMRIAPEQVLGQNMTKAPGPVIGLSMMTEPGRALEPVPDQNMLKVTEPVLD